MSELLPKPLTLVDAPHTLIHAIRTALVFLSWHEHLPKNERPPKRIWLDDKLLAEHFEMIDKARERESDHRTASNPEGWRGEPVQNDAAKMLIAE